MGLRDVCKLAGQPERRGGRAADSSARRAPGPELSPPLQSAGRKSPSSSRSGASPILGPRIWKFSPGGGTLRTCSVASQARQRSAPVPAARAVGAGVADLSRRPKAPEAGRGGPEQVGVEKGREGGRAGWGKEGESWRRGGEGRVRGRAPSDGCGRRGGAGGGRSGFHPGRLRSSGPGGGAGRGRKGRGLEQRRATRRAERKRRAEGGAEEGGRSREIKEGAYRRWEERGAGCPAGPASHVCLGKKRR